MKKIQPDQIIKSSRRTMALEVDKTGQLTVRIPYFIRQSDVRKFVENNAQWILKKKQEAALIAEKIKPKLFVDGERFPFLGQEYPLLLVEKQRPALSLDDHFKLSKAKRSQASKIFEKWYRAEAKYFISDRLNHYTDLMQLEHKNLHVTGAKTRWGSCSHDNNVNFTWRLIMAPVEIIDYVIVHELAHIKQKNHSKNFWAIVNNYVPDYQDKRKWLRKNGDLLTL